MRRVLAGAVIALLLPTAAWADPSGHVDASAAAIARGQVVFEHWCAPCHAAGRGHPGTVALRAKYGDSKPAELAARRDLSPELIHYFLRNGVSVMPFFRKTEITPSDEGDLIAYLMRKKP